MGAADTKLRKAIIHADYYSSKEARAKNLEDVRAALAKKPNLSSRDRNKWQPLHHAVWGSHEGVVRLLLEAGANPNAKTDRGRTPVHLAVWRPAATARAIIGVLLQHGARLDIKDDMDQTPSQHQKEYGKLKGVTLSRLKSGKLDEPEPKAPDHTDEARKLIKKYLGKKVTAKSNGALFDHEPATFTFTFSDPKKLWSKLGADYSDETEGWDRGTIVAVASVKSKGSPFAWVFLDWRKKKKMRVLITTTDDWGDDRTVKSLAALKLKT